MGGCLKFRSLLEMRKSCLCPASHPYTLTLAAILSEQQLWEKAFEILPGRVGGYAVHATGARWLYTGLVGAGTARLPAG